MEYDKTFYLEILEHLNIGIFVLDAKGDYLYVNDIYCQIVNKPPAFFQNMSVPKLKAKGYLTTSVWEQILQTNSPVVALLTITDKDFNRIYQLFISGIPTFNTDGSIKYIVFLVESIENLNNRIQLGLLNVHNYTDSNAVVSSFNVEIIAESPKMKQLLVLLTNVSRTDASILIFGPTGSGKEVLARYAHSTSTHKDGPFISVDCASIPENLLESELFGYEKGAFSGASPQGKKGQIELANGGTLFLDEINSMPLGLQSKLLRVLETRKIKRLGSLEERSIQFRLVCASNENLETLVQTGSFRSDLYYRISVVPVYIPPLRERKEDIVPLALFYLQFFCKKYSRMKVLSENLINAMLTYSWPGNVRELKNFIERIVVTTNQSDLQIETLPNSFFQNTKDMTIPHTSKTDTTPLPISGEEVFSYRTYMDQCEKQLIHDALAKFKTPAKIAEVLQLDISNVYRKMRKYQL